MPFNVDRAGTALPYTEPNWTFGSGVPLHTQWANNYNRNSPRSPGTGSVYQNRPRININDVSTAMNAEGWGRPNRRYVTTPYTGRGSKWIGAESSKYFKRAGRNLGMAIGGRYTADAWASARDMPRARSPKTGRFYSGPYTRSVYSVGTYNRSISGSNRARLAGAGVANMGRGLKKLPMRTKIAAPLAIGGAYFWMRRNKKDQFYTHYFDY